MNKEELKIQTIEKIFNIFGVSYLQEQADQISNLIDQNFIQMELLLMVGLYLVFIKIKEGKLLIIYH